MVVGHLICIPMVLSMSGQFLCVLCLVLFHVIVPYRPLPKTWVAMPSVLSTQTESLLIWTHSCIILSCLIITACVLLFNCMIISCFQLHYSQYIIVVPFIVIGIIHVIHVSHYRLVPHYSPNVVSEWVMIVRNKS